MVVGGEELMSNIKYQRTHPRNSPPATRLFGSGFFSFFSPADQDVVIGTEGAFLSTQAAPGHWPFCLRAPAHRTTFRPHRTTFRPRTAQPFARHRTTFFPPAQPSARTTPPPITAMGNTPSKRTAVWDPARYIDPDPRDDEKPFALLILNQEITDLELFENLWTNSSFRVCADGGANRLYTALKTDPARELMLPNAIVGDLDSLLPHVRAYYAAHSVPVIRIADQDSTDFAKCLDYISRHTGLQSPEFCEAHGGGDGWWRGGVRVSATHSPIPVVALGGFGGRVDQSLHSIHALYTTAPTRRLALVSAENVTLLLPPGRNTVLTPRRLLGPTCGLLPVGAPTVLTTQGLEWNLRDAESRFGGLVSTSNHLAAEEVVVDTSESVVFTVEIRRCEEEEEEEEEVMGVERRAGTV